MNLVSSTSGPRARAHSATRNCPRVTQFPGGVLPAFVEYVLFMLATRFLAFRGMGDGDHALFGRFNGDEIQDSVPCGGVHVLNQPKLHPLVHDPVQLRGAYGLHR